MLSITLCLCSIDRLQLSAKKKWFNKYFRLNSGFIDGGLPSHAQQQQQRQEKKSFWADALFSQDQFFFHVFPEFFRIGNELAAVVFVFSLYIFKYFVLFKLSKNCKKKPSLA